LKKIVVVLTTMCLALLGACGGEDAEEPTGPTEAVSSDPVPSPTPSVVETEEGETIGSDVADIVADLETCLNEGGIETESEEPAPPLYGEAGTIELTFEYPQITVPDAVTLWIFDSTEAAAKGKREIDKDLLEGDTETILRGQVVVDDFGNTLDTPEAAEQGEILDSCTA
jgi:hypothetical protein